jgi:hypothetical protein
MKRFLLSLAPVVLLPVLSFGWMGFGGGNDYSRDAGNMFYCASTGTVTTQAGVSASSPTISLYNPSNSGKNLVVLDVGINVMSAPAAAAQFSLAYNVTPSSGVNYSSTTNMGYVTAASVGISTVATSKGYVGTMKAICTLQGYLPATPTPFRYLGGTTGAAAISGVVFTDSTSGKVVVPPGGLISIQSSSAAALQAHILWREDNL